MGRAAIMINAKELQSLIDSVEASTTFPNYTELCKAVSEADINKACCKAGHRPVQIHQGQVYLAIKNGLVNPKTVKGKKGGGVGRTVNRKSRGEKFAENKQITEALNNLTKDAPEKYHSLIEKAKNGNKDALIRLKCVQCFGYSGMHKACDADGKTQPPCSLYALNLMFWPNRAEPEKFEYNPLDKR